MRRSHKTVLAAALVAMTATTALAEGLTLKAEGGIALIGAENVGIYSIVRTPPETATSQFEDYSSIPGGPTSLSYRGEANWAFDIGNGSQLRFGGILSGLTGTSSEVTPVYYLVSSQPGGPGNELILGELRACDFLNSCATFDG